MGFGECATVVEGRSHSEQRLRKTGLIGSALMDVQHPHTPCTTTVAAM